LGGEYYGRLAMSLYGTIDDVVTAYRSELARRAAVGQLKRFDDLLGANTDAAHAEAAVFDFLHRLHLQPENLEDLSEGGPDFRCHFAAQEFAVEVTAIGEPTLTRRSGMSNEPQVSYIDLAELLRAFDSRLSSKTGRAQAHKFSGPRVLAMVAKHIATNVLFLGGIEQFARAAFSSADGRPVRRAYSLVLFVEISGDASWVAGAEHPNPERGMSSEAFPRVPFARVVASSPEGVNANVEWVIGSPDPFKACFLPPALRRVCK
jgi:hypothetical protein